ncbi:MAG TPA: hypothetical protein VFE12_09565 [Acetobacteraceae bacterium]|nr:hypothetical protein [Acetobacteraceae bacterium]
MIDRAGTKMNQRWNGQRRQHDCRHLRGTPIDAIDHSPGHRGDQQQRRAEQQGRPQYQRDRLGARRAQQRPQQQNETGQGSIDDSRPVHQHARRIEPILHQVEPALSGDEIAHLDQPHGVVGRQRIEHPGLDGGHRKRESNRRAQQQHHNDEICRALRRLPIRRGGMTGRATPQPAKALRKSLRRNFHRSCCDLMAPAIESLPDRRGIDDAGMRARNGFDAA